MKKLIFVLILILSSCSSMILFTEYDDIYYSPNNKQISMTLLENTYKAISDTLKSDTYSEANVIMNNYYYMPYSSRLRRFYSPHYFRPYFYTPFYYDNFYYNPFRYRNYYDSYYDSYYNPYRNYYNPYWRTPYYNTRINVTSKPRYTEHRRPTTTNRNVIIPHETKTPLIIKSNRRTYQNRSSNNSSKSAYTRQTYSISNRSSNSSISRSNSRSSSSRSTSSSGRRR